MAEQEEREDQDTPAADAKPTEGPGHDGEPTAVISDIHGNLEALNVVFEDVEQRGIKRIICLGDIIGYGPNPRECLDLIMAKCEWSLMGNHDFAVLYEPTAFNASAEAAAFWTRRQLENEPDEELRRRRWAYLGDLEIRKIIGHSLYVHASPRRPINEYIFPDDVITSPSKMTQIFDRIDKVCYCGHTHVAGAFTDEPDFYPPEDLENVYRWDTSDKCIVNPGSLGQPRDRDSRAAYGIVYEDRMEFMRIEYDIDAVIDKVGAVEELTEFLGARLVEGR